MLIVMFGLGSFVAGLLVWILVVLLTG